MSCGSNGSMGPRACADRCWGIRTTYINICVCQCSGTDKIKDQPDIMFEGNLIGC